MAIINGTAGDDALVGTEGDDTISAGAGNDVVRALGGNDTIITGPGTDTVFGGDGDDVVVVSGRGSGIDGQTATAFVTVDGGAGQDTVDATAVTAVPVNRGSSVLNWTYDADFGLMRLVNRTTSVTSIGTFTQDSEVLRLSSVERLIGSGAGNFVDFTGLTTPVTFVGGTGVDSLRGGYAADVLEGGAGDDLLHLGNGDTLSGDDGADSFIASSDAVFSGGSAQGGAGVDTLRIDLVGGLTGTFDTAAGFTWRGIAFAGVETILVRQQAGTAPQAGSVDIQGGSGADRLFYEGDGVTPSGVTLRGGGGNDTITSLGVGDFLYGGDGDDVISGNGWLFGDAGDDTVQGVGVLHGGAGADTLSRASFAGTSDLHGDDGDDTITIALNDRGYGGAGNDRFVLTSFPGAVEGGSGFDSIEFSAGVRITNAVWTGGPSSQFTVTVQGTIGAPVDYTGFLDIEQIVGTVGADVMNLSGAGYSMTLIGGAGDDTLTTGAFDDRLIGGLGNDALNGGAGLDLAVFAGSRASAGISYSGPAIIVDGPDGRDTLTSIEALSFNDGVYDVVNGVVASQARQTVAGTANADVLSGAGSNDTIRGLDGNDVLTGRGGSDVLDGGAGVDAAVYAGVRRQYATSHTAVSGGPEGGTDTLVSIENTRFLDGTITYDENSTAAEILRIYDATLDRGPDAFGLDGWLQARAGGTTLVQMANSFVNSDEFKARYGALDNDAFVSLLYNFCLNRNVDPLGLKSYTDLLKSGAWSRGDVVLSLSESVEHRQLMAPQLDQGLWVADQTTLTIARLYDATFDRLPDLFGLDAWRQEIAAGRSLNSMAAAFAGSQEFQDRYGALGNADFVRLIYTFCLDRNVDPLGLSSYTDLLNSGQWTRADVLLSLSESSEHRQLTAPLWYDGVRYQGYAGAPVEDAGSAKDDAAFTLPVLHEDASAADGPGASPVPGLSVGQNLVAGADLALGAVGHPDDAFVLSADDAVLRFGSAALERTARLDAPEFAAAASPHDNPSAYADAALAPDDASAFLSLHHAFLLRADPHDTWM
ncbi:hypothetical protein MMB232_00186 [Brevundimonas subvibrioides]|uniref:DUF4214 domain-containing protein n=1 Tax=Brevundimonas subvibrioides TaxID=74313 RepID=UPI0032D56DE8